MHSLLINTLWAVGGTWLLALPLGAVIGWWLARVEFPGRRWLGAGFLFLLLIPLYLQAAGWDAGLGRQGWWTYRTSSVQAPWLSGWTALLVIHAAHALPWVIVISAAGFRWVACELEDEARLELSLPLIFLTIALRRAWPAILLAAIWVLALVSGEMTVTDMYQVRTLAEELYTGFALGDNLLMITLHLLPLIVLCAVLMAILVRAQAAWAPAVGLSWSVQRQRLTVGRGGWWMTLTVGTLFVLLALVPLGNLLYQAGLSTQRVGADWQRSWQFAKLLQMVGQTPWRFRDEWWGTLRLATTTALLSVVCGCWAAWWSRERALRWWLVGWLGVLAVAIPGPLFAVALLQVRDYLGPTMLDDWMDQSLILVALVLSLRGVPLVWAICWFAFRSLPMAQREFAEVSGVGPWRQLWVVVLPQRRAVVLASGLLAWVLAAGDVTVSILLLPPGETTVAIRTFQLVHAGVDDRLAGLTLATILMFGCLGVLIRGSMIGGTGWLRGPGERYETD
ncbi:MAG: ABC transporter permease [Planctomycetota bacterium]